MCVCSNGVVRGVTSGRGAHYLNTGHQLNDGNPDKDDEKDSVSRSVP